MHAHHVARTVVVGIDGSESALEAVRWAAREADRRQVPLRLVNAFGWPDTRHIGDAGFGGGSREVLLRSARKELAAAAAVADQAAPGMVVEQQLVVGFPVPVLQAEATRAQLVVLGHRGLGGFTGLLVGSVAVALAAHAACPVIVVRGSGLDAPSEGPVVVGVDGSPTSEAAIAFAFGAAAARGVPLVAVHTWWDLLVDPAMAPMLDWDAIEVDERQVLAEGLAG